MGHNRLKKLKGYGILKTDRNREHFYLVYCYPYSQMFLNGWLQSMLLRCLVIRFLTLVASASQGTRDKHRINFFPSQLSKASLQRYLEEFQLVSLESQQQHQLAGES